MSQVEFEEENTILAQVPKQTERIPLFGKTLLKMGIVKNSTQINGILLIVALAIFSLSIYIFFNFV